jgi:hypothetical protein
MATDRIFPRAIPAAAALLLWPALWNRYPIVFADTGTYLSQTIEHYAGWDRPVFYSLFMLPLHATLTVWPVVVVQALLAAWVLWLVCLVLVPDISGVAFVGFVFLLSWGTWLPWLVCELMPDLFTPLLVLVLCLLAWVPARLSRWQQIALVGLAAFMIASQQSSLPLACVLLVALGLLRRAGRSDSPLHRWLLIVLPPALAVLGLCTANLAAHGRFAIAPFGNVFLLARVIYDGPGRTTLRRDCPTETWILCPFLDDLPANSDDFLWTRESPLYRAGGPKTVSRDADAIIAASLLADPATEAQAALANALQQLTRFASGDGLNAWPSEVSPVIARHFPAREQAAYARARQQAGSLAIPAMLARIHAIVALAGILACALLLLRLIGTRHPANGQHATHWQRAACAGFLIAALLTLPVSAAITGALSAPHDRYQARVMWLPPFVAVPAFAAMRRRRA